jgi:hypothetical protein
MSSQAFDAYARGMLARAHPRRTPPGFDQELLNLIPVGGVRRSRPALRPYIAGDSVSSVTVGLGWHTTASGTRELVMIDGAATDAIYRAKPYQAVEELLLPAVGLYRTDVDRAFVMNLSGGANLSFIYDGVNPNLKYDGTAVSKMGIGAAATPAVPTNDTGAASTALTNGTRKYVHTYVSAYHEGNPTPVGSAREVTLADSGNSTTQRSSFVLPSSGTIDDSQVTSVKLYRTIKDGEDYFYVTSGAPGATVTDDVSDEALIESEALEEFINAEPPGPFVALVEHRGQLVGIATDDRGILHHSYFDPEYMVPEGWPAQWVTPVRPGDSDTCNGLASFHEWLIVGKGKSLHKLTGTWPDYEVSPLEVAGATDAGIGIAHQGCFVHAGNTLLALTREGLVGIERYGGEVADIQAKRLSGPINDLWNGIDYANVIGGVFDRRKQTVMFFVRGA